VALTVMRYDCGCRFCAKRPPKRLEPTSTDVRNPGLKAAAPPGVLVEQRPSA
jgi:hypothetical protein